MTTVPTYLQVEHVTVGRIDRPRFYHYEIRSGFARILSHIRQLTQKWTPVALDLSPRSPFSSSSSSYMTAALHEPAADNNGLRRRPVAGAADDSGSDDTASSSSQAAPVARRAPPASSRRAPKGFVELLFSPLSFVLGDGEPEDPQVSARAFTHALRRRYGSVFPRFEHTSFRDAVSTARTASKFLLVFLHSNIHDEADTFCRCVCERVSLCGGR